MGKNQVSTPIPRVDNIVELIKYDERGKRCFINLRAIMFLSIQKRCRGHDGRPVFGQTNLRRRDHIQFGIVGCPNSR